MRLEGILEGEIVEQSSPDTTLRTIGLYLVKKGTTKPSRIPNGNLTITSNGSGNPRVDLIQWNGVTLSVKAGTAAANPDCPAPDAGYIPVAVVYVPTGFTTVRSIGFIDAAITAARIIGFYSALTGLWGWISLTNTVQTNQSSALEITTVRLPLYIPRSHPGYVLRYGGTVNIDVAAANGARVIPMHDSLNTGFVNAMGNPRILIDGLAVSDQFQLMGESWRPATTIGAHRFGLGFGPIVNANNVTLSGIFIDLKEFR